MKTILLLRVGLLLVCFHATANSLAAADLFYRSIRSGFWDDISIWEIALDPEFSSAVSAALIAPDYTIRTVQISSGTTVTIASAIHVDEVQVESGGTLAYGNDPSAGMTIADGPGVDLQIDGTFEDNGSFNVIWASSQASWALGISGVIVRTRSTSATLWRDHYANGMATIPATSTWILRKHTTDHPSISGVNSYYGNLKIENNTALFWNANLVGSKIIGASSAPVIKGNFEIGVSGLSGVKFYSQNSAFSGILVKGDLVIGLGSEFHFEDAGSTTGASGVALEGNLVVHGTLSYDPSDVSDQNRMVKFSGENDQYLSGNGTVFLYNFVNQKNSGKLILNQDISIVNRLVLDKGELDLNSHTLTILNSVALAVQRTNGWIKTEAYDFSSRMVWNIGTTEGLHEFPFGKNKDTYIPVAVRLETGDLGAVEVSTYGTAADNRPLPIVPVVVTNLEINGTDNSQRMFDRFWYLAKTGSSGTAEVSFCYSPEELPPQSVSLIATPYNDVQTTWEPLFCCQVQDPVLRKVTVRGVSTFSLWTLTEESDALYLDDEGGEEKVQAELSWLSAYPVPFQDVLFVVLNEAQEETVRIEVVNVSGVKLFEKVFPVMKGVNRVLLDFSTIYEKGIYFIKITGRSSVKEYKVVRE